MIKLFSKKFGCKCDLCVNKDTPVCTESCPTNALTFDADELVASKQDKIVNELNRQ